MPEADSSHTASPDASKAAADHPLASLDSPGARPDLSALFRSWEHTPVDAERARLVTQGLRLRGLVTAALALAAGLVMALTASAWSYFTEPASPRELGDLRADDTIAPAALARLDNRHVRLSGLVPTRLIALSAEPSPPPERVTWLFYCPLSGLVVRAATRPEIAAPPSAPAANAPGAARLAALIVDGLALPEEAAASIAAEGRVIRADEAPSELRPFVASFAQRVRRDPSELGLLLAGVRPSDFAWVAWVWALSALTPMISLLFFVRAWRAARIEGARS